jgi:CRP-like cAMP-binding protein
VAHPLMPRAIAAAKKKNDRIDAGKIADCLRCDFLPECHMASPAIRDRRRTLRYRHLLVRQMVQIKNRISDLLMETGVSHNKQRLHKVGYFRELLSTNEEIDESIRPLLRLSRETIVRLQKTEYALVSSLQRDHLLADRIERLRTVPGVGPITTGNGRGLALPVDPTRHQLLRALQAEGTATERTGLPMTAKHVSLCTRLKQVGFTQGNQMKLHGQEFELLGEPIVMADNLVFVDAIEKKSGRLRRVRIPLGEGDFFGEGWLAGQTLRMCSAAAMTDCAVLRIDKKAMMEALHREYAFSDMFVAYLLSRNIRYEEDLVDQLFNSSEKRLARILLLLAHFGKEGNPESVVPKISREVLAEMIGTTRSRVIFFMNRFRKLGFIHYNGGLQVHSSLLNLVLHDQLFSPISQETKRQRLG